jgi:hypothetical protein
VSTLMIMGGQGFEEDAAQAVQDACDAWDARR